MKTKILVTLIVLCSFGLAAQDIHFTMDNARITNDGVDDFYEADIYMESSIDFKLGSGQIYFTYNEAAFGPNISDNGNFDYLQPDGSILAEAYGFPAYKDFIQNDNTTFRVSTAFQQGVSSGTITENNVTAMPKHLFSIKIRYIDAAQDPTICFETQPVFLDQFYTACGPETTGFPNCTNEPGIQLFNDTFDCAGATLPAGCAGVTTYTIAGGWDNGTPDSTMEAVISENLSTGGLSIEACSLTVMEGAILTIQTGDYLRTENDIIVDGDLRVAHGASVVQVENSAVVINNGSILVQKDLDNIENRGFALASSPMTTETQAAFGAPIQFRNHITANFSPNEDVEANFPGAGNFADDNGNNWMTYDGMMNPGEGYLVMPQQTAEIPAPADYTANFDDGTLNNGIISFEVEYNGTQNASMNVLGNPYPSAIDADLFIAENEMIEGLYFWEHLTSPSTTYEGYNPSNYSMGDISMYSTVMGGNPAANGGATPNGFVPSGEGFAVKALVAGSAEFNNAMRVTGNNDVSGRLSLVERDRVWLNVFNETHGLGSTSLLGFSEITSEGFDPGADIIRLATPVSLYQELETGEQLGIQGREAFTSEAIVPFSFATQVETLESYRISIHDLDGTSISEATVYLIDHTADIITNLNEQSYAFTATAGTYSNRFSIVFEDRTLGVSSGTSEAVLIYPNPTQDILFIKTPNTQIKTVEVFDIRGRKVQQNSNVIDQLNLSNLKSAVYFVKITTDTETLIKRIIKE
ncbi:T9SS type A sorting domain-containing protein [Cochleicola gelatinilyticus]|uniref:Secretion system C-terminal sorting domain-containing protein n=1 Tax=Cochleicola gelatinilyticus TaxID=1763537 RepID=A0A167HJX8_9FLAO|nr:T9SS type A sorting domain-containing protein [Cochleicola gelatinilyticus]OAB78689.1 hypothetical protein ULVI_08895 [Cochleicola gelatinilyticus]